MIDNYKKGKWDCARHMTKPKKEDGYVDEVDMGDTWLIPSFLTWGAWPQGLHRI